MTDFTREWDETYPPDTQLANLLGRDIREAKLDVRERLMNLGGVESERPTPESMFGTVNNGVMYFAKDTGKIFFWDGTQWNDVTTSFVRPIDVGTVTYDFDNQTAVTLVNPGVETDGLVLTLPKGTLKAGSVVQLYAAGKMQSASGNLQGVNFKWGDNLVAAGINDAAPATDAPRYFPQVYTVHGKAYEYVEHSAAWDIYRPYTSDLALRSNLAFWVATQGGLYGSADSISALPGGYAPSDAKMLSDNFPLTAPAIAISCVFIFNTMVLIGADGLSGVGITECWVNKAYAGRVDLITDVGNDIIVKTASLPDSDSKTVHDILHIRVRQ